jgi:DNA topoisomerase IA
LDEVRQYIVTTYAEGEKYIGSLINSTNVEEIVVKKTKKSKKVDMNTDVKAQEAHEAIRPTNISLCELPDTLDLGSKERRMYKLIWSNA